MKAILILVIALFSFSSFARVYDCWASVTNNPQVLRETFQWDTSVEDVKFIYLEGKSNWEDRPLFANFRLSSLSDFMDINVDNSHSITSFINEIGKKNYLKISKSGLAGAGIDWTAEISCTLISL